MNFVDSFPPHDEKDIIYGIMVGMLNPYCIVKVLPQGNKIYAEVVVYEPSITSQEVIDKYGDKLSKKAKYCISNQDANAKSIYKKNNFCVTGTNAYVEKCFEYLIQNDLFFLNGDFSVNILNELQHLPNVTQDMQILSKFSLRILRTISVALPAAVNLGHLSYSEKKIW